MSALSVTTTASWVHRADCLEHPTLPAHTWDAHVEAENGHTAVRRARVTAAQAVCDTCPVAQPCLDDFLAGHGGGVRAGYVFPDDAPTWDTFVEHGTTRGLQMHAALGETPCEVCASAEWERTERRRPDCGSASGRRAHLARGEDVCDDCAEAYREWNRARMAASRAGRRRADAERVPA